MKKIIVVLFLAIMILSACVPSVTSGTVIEKKHEPERSWIQMMPMKVGKITSYIPITHHDDEDWILIISDSEGNKGYINVDKSTFESVEIGSFFELVEESK